MMYTFRNYSYCIQENKYGMWVAYVYNNDNPRKPMNWIAGVEVDVYKAHRVARDSINLCCEETSNETSK